MPDKNVIPLRSVVHLCCEPCHLCSEGPRMTDVPEELVSGYETILYDGTVRTVDGNGTITEPVAIRDGRFLAVGETEEIRETNVDLTLVGGAVVHER